MNLRFLSWLKWRRQDRKTRRRRKRRIQQQQEPIVIDEFLFYYQQYRPANAIPDGWFSTQEKCSIEDCLSRDSGRSSGGLEESTSSSHEVVYDQPKQLVNEDKDSGVSSLIFQHFDEEEQEVWEPLDFKESNVQQHHCQQLFEPTKSEETSWLKILTLILLLISFAAFPIWFESSQNLKIKAFEVETFKELAKKNVIGQELAVQEIIHVMNEFNHLKSGFVKVLVMSGSSGTGKTLLSQFIMETFAYQSQKVFYHQEMIHQIQAQSCCQPSLFILEDVQDSKLINDLLIIKSRNPTLIIITTRLGSEKLNSKVMEWLKLANFQFNEEIHTVLKRQLYQDLQAQNDRNLNLIPLLPLTRQHVKLCIQSQSSVSSKELQWIVNQMAFFSPTFPVFSVHGCKPVGKLVELLSLLKQQHRHAMS